MSVYRVHTAFFLLLAAAVFTVPAVHAWCPHDHAHAEGLVIVPDEAEYECTLCAVGTSATLTTQPANAGPSFEVTPALPALPAPLLSSREAPSLRGPPAPMNR